MIITHQQVLLYFLIFARFLGLISLAPIFSRKEFFSLAKFTLNKIAEQVNVFQLGFQVKPYVSLIVFLAALPVLIPVIESVLDRIAEEIVLLLKALQG